MFVQAGHATRFYACARVDCTREWLIQPGEPYVRISYPLGLPSLPLGHLVEYRHTEHAKTKETL